MKNKNASDEAWNLFCKTGEVSHYLLKCALSESERRQNHKDER